MTEPAGDQLELIVTTTEKFVQLRHDQIHPNPNNVRTDLGDLHDLEESIWNVGLGFALGWALLWALRRGYVKL